MDLTMIEILSSYSSVEVYLGMKKSINIEHLMKWQRNLQKIWKQDDIN